MINWRQRGNLYISLMNPFPRLYPLFSSPTDCVNGIGFVCVFEKFPPIKSAPFHLITSTRSVKQVRKRFPSESRGLVRGRAFSWFFILIADMGIVIQLMSSQGELALFIGRKNCVGSPWRAFLIPAEGRCDKKDEIRVTQLQSPHSTSLKPI